MMSVSQLWLVVGLPIIVNVLLTGILALIITQSLASQLSSLRTDLIFRLTALEKLMDARFESLEREIHHREESN